MEILVPLYVLAGGVAMAMWAAQHRDRIRSEARERGTVMPKFETSMTMMGVFLAWPLYALIEYDRRRNRP